MGVYGTQADLARRLDVTRAAISKAFKKHQIQTSADGQYDLDYLAFLFKEKQDQAKSAGQRNKAKKPPHIKNPAAIRLVVAALGPVWDAAILETMAYCVDPESDIDADEAFEVMTAFWTSFQGAFDKHYPVTIGDHPLSLPSIIADYFNDGLTVDDLITMINEPLPDGVIEQGEGL